MNCHQSDSAFQEKHEPCRCRDDGQSFSFFEWDQCCIITVISLSAFIFINVRCGFSFNICGLIANFLFLFFFFQIELTFSLYSILLLRRHRKRTFLSWSIILELFMADEKIILWSYDSQSLISNFLLLSWSLALWHFGTCQSTGIFATC